MSPVLGRFSAAKPIPLLFLVVFSVSAFYWMLRDNSAPRPVLDPAVRVTAPEFPAGMDWINTDHALTLRELRGKIVLLDFWTYGCINCLHALADIKQLEEKYPNELVVMGVHSGKFANERRTRNLRKIVVRYGIAHPVVNDADFAIWDAYKVNAWPTMYLIDPEGKALGYASGENVFPLFDDLIAQAIALHARQGTIDRTPRTFPPERDGPSTTELAFPGKVLADAAGDRLFIADTGNHRIVVTTMDGLITDTIGSGEAGFRDGPFDAAALFQPQGLALDGDVLYIADTGNHAIRRADLTQHALTTIAGTGEQARQHATKGNGRTWALNSPWDLLWHNGLLYIAMAGPHQIWTLDPRTGKAWRFAGSGREGILDAEAAYAALAQPSGLATSGSTLFFVDSESSAVRRVAFDPDAKVQTLIGKDLFDFGDRDGPSDQAQLQHPLGIAWHDALLYVADTYNHKIKTVTSVADTHFVETLAGTGEPGLQDGPMAQFDEPGGVSVADDLLYVADTNNHAIRRVHLRTRDTTTVLLR